MDEDFAAGAHPNCIQSEDIRGSYLEHELLMEHLRSRGRKLGLPQFGPSTTKLRFVWDLGSRYKPSRARDNSSSIKSRRGRLGSYSDKSVYSSDDGGSHSNQSEYLDGADEKGKSSIHPRRRSEGSFHTHAQEEDLDSDAADEESCASKEQQERPPSSRQGTNKMRRWHSILIPSYAVPPTNPFERISSPGSALPRSNRLYSDLLLYRVSQEVVGRFRST
jgi:hypothetical protein